MGVLAVSVFLQAQAEECSSCHKVRHGDAQCLNCHWNASTVSSEHPRKPYVPSSIHSGFDWEADDMGEKNLPGSQESCPACHADLKEHTSQVVNTCVDCHKEGRYTAASTLLIRDNISSLIPGVYSHYLNTTPAVSRDASCFGYNASTGEGSCHGVGFMYRNRSGGYFAFNLNYTDMSIRSDIYHWTSSIDNLPPPENCTFCHKQEDPLIRKAWGDPRLPQDPPHIDADDNNCLDCHVDGQFKSFHGREIVRTKKKSYLVEGAVAILLISAVAGALYLRKRR